MGGNKVHENVHRALRIIFQNAHNPIPECGGSFALDIGDNGLPERIVHHAVQLIAQEIAALYAVCLLIGRILPDLTDYNFFFAELLDTGAQVV